MKKRTKKIESGSFDHFYEEQRKKSETSAERKLLNYIKKLFEKGSFREELEQIRERNNIPKEGFKKVYVTKKIGSKRFKHLQTPEEMGYSFDDKKYRNDLYTLFEKYGLSDGLAGSWTNFISLFALYEAYDFDDLYTSYGYMMFGMLDVVDLESMLSPNYEDEPAEDTVSFLKQFTEGKPIAILINPYASERDILDFVKKLYKHSILPLLDSYKRENVELGKKRRKNSRLEERDKFIYENRLLPKKELIQLVSKEYKEVMEQSYLNKIIREEKAKRK